MNRSDKIAAIVKKVSGKALPPEHEESLFDSGYLDSFSLAELVLELEKEFSITIPDSDLNPRRFASIGRIEESVGNYCN